MANKGTPNPNYNRTDWATGDLIDEQKLDKIQNQLNQLTQGVSSLIEIKSGSTPPTSAYNQIWITQQQNGGEDFGTNDYSLISQSEFNSLLNLIAEQYTPGNDYSVGDYVYKYIQNNIGEREYTLYKCIRNITDAPTIIEADTNWIEDNICEQLNSLQQQIESNSSNIFNHSQSISNLFNPRISYSAGSYCIYNNKLYECKTDVAANSGWDNTKWEAVQISTLIKHLNDNVLINRGTLLETDDIQNLKPGIYNKKNSHIPAHWPNSFPGELVSEEGTLLYFSNILMYFPSESKECFFKTYQNLSWEQWIPLISYNIFAPEFNSSTPYEWGAYVTHNNKLYYCTPRNSAQDIIDINGIVYGSWKDYQWAQTNISSIVLSLQGKIANQSYERNQAITQAITAEAQSRESADSTQTSLRELYDSILASNFAEEYNKYKSYNIGERVIHNKLLYACIQQTSGTLLQQQEFDNNKWAKTDIDEWVNRNSQYASTSIENITNYINNLNDGQIISLLQKRQIKTNSDNNPINITPTANDSYQCIAVTCAQGDIFTITGDTSYANSQHYLWSFIKSNYTIIANAHANEGEVATNKVITAPANAAYLVVNAKMYYPALLCKRKNIQAKFNELWPSLRYRGMLNSSMDIHNLETGIYRKNSPNTPINWPDEFPDGVDSGYGILISFRVSNEYSALIYFPGKHTGSGKKGLRLNNSCFFKFTAGANVSWGPWLSFKTGTGNSVFNINQNAIISEFDPGHEYGYNEGEYVLYDSNIYKFISNHAGDWDTQDVEEIEIGKELTSLKDLINYVFNQTSSAINTEKTNRQSAISLETQARLTNDYAILTTLAPQHTTNKSYSKGQCVIYEYKLYKATKDIGFGQEFSLNNFTETTVSELLNEIRALL